MRSATLFAVIATCISTIVVADAQAWFSGGKRTDYYWNRVLLIDVQMGNAKQRHGVTPMIFPERNAWKIKRTALSGMEPRKVVARGPVFIYARTAVKTLFATPSQFAVVRQHR